MAVETAPEGRKPLADRPLRGGRFERPPRSGGTPGCQASQARPRSL